MGCGLNINPDLGLPTLLIYFNNVFFFCISLFVYFFTCFLLFLVRSHHTEMRRLERELYEVNLLRKQAIDDQE